MELKRYYVETWGCQMNVLDSQHLAGVLESCGLALASHPGEADVVLLNTCSVREKAAQKVLSRLGELRALKEASGRPRVIGLCGCVAEQEGARLLARSRVLDFVLGPGKFSQLPGLLDGVGGDRRAVTGFAASRDYDADLIARGDSVRQFVTVVHGCDQHCTFCIVPYTRGREVSRSLPEIVAEVRALVASGVREVTLLGQTVNAYRCPRTGADFAELLLAVGEEEGLWRLHFLTSHPRFFTPALLAALPRVRALGRYLHLPFQSGSDTVLRRMHRGYTSSEYLDLVGRIREAVPDVTMSTDVIVGFPGESDEDFEATMQLAEAGRFGQLYGFIFSPRPRTPAARYPGRVERSVAGARLDRLFALQSAVQLELNQALVGSCREVLADGPARRGENLWQGRGDDNRVVVFPAPPGVRAGHLLRLTITGASAHGLLGEVVAAEPSPASA